MQRPTMDVHDRAQIWHVSFKKEQKAVITLPFYNGMDESRDAQVDVLDTVVTEAYCKFCMYFEDPDKRAIRIWKKFSPNALQTHMNTLHPLKWLEYQDRKFNADKSHEIKQFFSNGKLTDHFAASIELNFWTDDLLEQDIFVDVVRDIHSGQFLGAKCLFSVHEKKVTYNIATHTLQNGTEIPYLVWDYLTHYTMREPIRFDLLKAHIKRKHQTSYDELVTQIGNNLELKTPIERRDTINSHFNAISSTVDESIDLVADNEYFHISQQNTSYKQWQSSIKSRNKYRSSPIEYKNLTEFDFDILKANDCYYCQLPNEHSDYFKIGFDRIYSTRNGHYTVENIVGACTPCNYGKACLPGMTFVCEYGRKSLVRFYRCSVCKQLDEQSVFQHCDVYSK